MATVAERLEARLAKIDEGVPLRGTGDEKRATAARLRRQGKTPAEVISGAGINTKTYEAWFPEDGPLGDAAGKAEQARKLARMQELRDKGWSYAAIGRAMGVTKAWAHRMLTEQGDEPAEYVRLGFNLPASYRARLDVVARTMGAVDEDGAPSIAALLTMVAAGRLRVVDPDDRPGDDPAG